MDPRLDPDLRVNSIHFGWQWEGQNMGLYALFVVLQGCPSSCFNCPYATDASCQEGEEVTVDEMMGKEDRPEASYAVLKATQLFALIREIQDAPFSVVITGGEPAKHNLTALTGLLIEDDFLPIVHTGGEIPFEVIKGTLISIRPRTRLVIPQALNVADEVILVIKDENDLTWLDVLLEHVDDTRCEVFLQASTPEAFPFLKEVVPTRGFRISYRPVGELPKRWKN